MPKLLDFLQIRFEDQRSIVISWY